MAESIKRFLTQNRVAASAPCRIDSGGTWDIKAMALPMARVNPTTVNIALDMRTSVVLIPYEDGRVKLSSEGFSGGEEASFDRLPLDAPFGLFYAAIAYFGFHGLEVRVHSRSPVKSALGGSSTALVALIKAFSRVSTGLGRKGLSDEEILHLAYHLEDGISGGNCGLQDQAAAVYGGVNQWKWNYGSRSVPVERVKLLGEKGQKELSKRLVVAYSGETHVSSITNRDWIEGFLSGRTRQGWIRVNDIVHRFARAVEEMNWEKAADLLRQEVALRRELTPEALIPITQKLVDQAEKEGCGARFAGAGAGGSVWALGEKKDIERLRKIWEKTLDPVTGAMILDCRVETEGVK